MPPKHKQGIGPRVQRFVSRPNNFALILTLGMALAVVAVGWTLAA